MFVDLGFIKKNILQRIQRRIPRSEIVHGNADIPVVEEADRLLVIGGNLFPHHGRILPGDIDNADKDIGVIAVHKECLQKEFQLFQDEIQNVRTRLITPVIVDQMKIVDIRHQKGVLLFFASVIEKRKNFFFRIWNPFSLRNFFKKAFMGTDVF